MPATPSSINEEPKPPAVPGSASLPLVIVLKTAGYPIPKNPNEPHALPWL